MQFVSYHKKYHNRLSNVMKETWNFLTFFPDANNKSIIYELALDSLLTLYTYSSVVLDDENRVCGCLIGVVNKKVTLGLKILKIQRSLKLFLKAIFYILTNKLGSRNEVWKYLIEIDKIFKSLQKDKHMFHSSIELLMLSPSCRGKGIGKSIMDNFVNYCKESDAKSIFLYTDRGCTYEFYDKYGYVRHDSIHSSLLHHPEFEYNGFVYTYFF